MESRLKEKTALGDCWNINRLHVAADACCCQYVLIGLAGTCGGFLFFFSLTDFLDICTISLRIKLHGITLIISLLLVAKVVVCVRVVFAYLFFFPLELTSVDAFKDTVFQTCFIMSFNKEKS